MHRESCQQLAIMEFFVSRLSSGVALPERFAGDYLDSIQVALGQFVK